MKKTFVVFFVVLLPLRFFAQEHGVGFTSGMSGYYGDIGSSVFFRPKNPAYGFSYKWYRNERWVPRTTFSFLKITPKAADTSDPVSGGYLFGINRTIQEFTIGIEFNFFAYRPWLRKTSQWTPYFIFEVAAYQHNRYKSMASTSGSLNFKANKSTFRGVAIPFGIGFKFNPFYRWSVAIEARIRYTLKDNLDDSYFVYQNYMKPNKVYYANRFTNINTNDFYTFFGTTFTYIIGERPCIR